MLYCYKCPECGHKFEGQAGMNDPCPPCPNEVTNPDRPEGQRGGYTKTCGGTTEKDYNWGKAPGVQFKGGGWAADGYSSNK